MDPYEGMSEDIYYLTHFDAPPWSSSEDQILKTALCKVPEETPNRWLQIALFLPGRMPNDIEEHCKASRLEEDHLGSPTELPIYSDPGQSSLGSPQLVKEDKKKKGSPWTEEEHRLFLMGLQMYGKGDWRSISRNVLRTKTTYQIASHAQKYFERQKMENRHKKRSSIHDITTPYQGPTVMASSAVPAPAPTYLPAQCPTAFAVPAPTPPSITFAGPAPTPPSITFAIPAPAPIYDLTDPNLEPTIYNSWI